MSPKTTGAMFSPIPVSLCVLWLWVSPTFRQIHPLAPPSPAWLPTCKHLQCFSENMSWLQREIVSQTLESTHVSHGHRRGRNLADWSPKGVWCSLLPKPGLEVMLGILVVSVGTSQLPHFLSSPGSLERKWKSLPSTTTMFCWLLRTLVLTTITNHHTTIGLASLSKLVLVRYLGRENRGQEDKWFVQGQQLKGNRMRIYLSIVLNNPKTHVLFNFPFSTLL